MFNDQNSNLQYEHDLIEIFSTIVHFSREVTIPSRAEGARAGILPCRREREYCARGRKYEQDRTELGRYLVDSPALSEAPSTLPARADNSLGPPCLKNTPGDRW